ncbi:uncharacterized protein LOC111880756 [Lactuca sativa]|uniref:uncharacterized protein LOC111880756 n=1 Tax=Lactuca sativa TaxID=4236 RepID=UPI000CD933F8|nr:uncharacterized protein LOC111880756 [Lactuca sativa]
MKQVDVNKYFERQLDVGDNNGEGHDETENFNSKGLFIEVLSLIREDNEKIFKVTLENAPKNEKLTSSTIQKDIVNCFSKEIIESICDEIGKDVFGILIDECSDVSKKEQMAIVLRYVDRLGIVKERFIGVLHVLDTSSLTLKAAIDTVRGKVMMDQVINENSFTHYIHCFAHQLQLVVVAVAKKHDDVEEIFEQLGLVVTFVCGSLETEIGIGGTETGRELNQEISLFQVGDTRWGSHFRTIVSLLKLFAEVVTVVKYVKEEWSTLSNRNQAKGILSYFKTLDFVFLLQLMLEILCLMDTLSNHLKKRSRYFGSDFVRKDGFPQIWKKRRTNKTNQHHSEVVIFNMILDMQIQEFGERFSEVGTELMENMVDLSPCDSFSGFDKVKLLKLSEIYKNDFDDSKRAQLNGQLDTYYHSLLHDESFST